MKKIIFILFFSLMMITSVSAIDSNDWKIIKIQNHEFKIPPQYNNGKLEDTYYTVGDWHNFRISMVDDSLPTVYGFAASDTAYKEDLIINDHPVRYFNEYNTAENANVSRAFFSVDESIYMISWKSNSFESDIKEIIALSDKSNLTTEEFYDTLKEALDEYNDDEQDDLNTPDTVYINSNDHHHYLPYIHSIYGYR